MHVVAPATPADAKGMLKTAIRGKDPVIFLESAALYGMKGEVPDDPDFTVPFGKSRVAREGNDVTIVSYSRMLQLSLDRRGQAVEGRRHRVRGHRPALAPAAGHGSGRTRRWRRRIAPWWCRSSGSRSAPPRRSRPASPRAMFDELDAPVARVTGEDVPMPYARNLELLATPHEPEIIRAVKKVMYANG